MSTSPVACARHVGRERILDEVRRGFVIQFRRPKIIALAAFVVGCLLNPLSPVASYVVIALAIARLGSVLLLEAYVTRELKEATYTEEGEEFVIDGPGFTIRVARDSSYIKWPSGVEAPSRRFALLVGHLVCTPRNDEVNGASDGPDRTMASGGSSL